jgi:hypothetical protein
MSGAPLGLPGVKVGCLLLSPVRTAAVVPAGVHGAFPGLRSHGFGVACGSTVPLVLTFCGICVPRCF